MPTDTIQAIQWILIGQALVGSIGALAFCDRLPVEEDRTVQSPNVCLGERSLPSNLRG
jgi:hypothetical protein